MFNITRRVVLRPRATGACRFASWWNPREWNKTSSSEQGKSDARSKVGGAGGREKPAVEEATTSVLQEEKVVDEQRSDDNVEKEMNDEQPKVTHFGYRDVPVDQKERLVGEVFDGVAESYDLMNDAMSAGLHRLWKHAFVERMNLPGPQHQSGFTLLDVAGGTGDIAFRCMERLQHAPFKIAKQHDVAQVIVCDINESMLKVGEQRAAQRGLFSAKEGRPTLRFVQGNAEQLPFESDSVDLYTIAFGLRNVTNTARALKEAHRVLKPGGRFMCLEFSPLEKDSLIAPAYDLYSFEVIPRMGQIIADDRASYEYLVESIRRFAPREQLLELMRSCGFREVSYENMAAGIVALHSGYKL